MRSLEELHTLLIQTFCALMEKDTQARLNGGWVVHITMQNPPENSTEKFKKVYVDKDMFDSVLEIMEKAYAEMKEESVKTPQAIRRQLKKLGILTKHNAAFHTKGWEGAPSTEHNCVVFNQELLNWYLDTPLHSGEKNKSWQNNA